MENTQIEEPKKPASINEILSPDNLKDCKSDKTCLNNKHCAIKLLTKSDKVKKSLFIGFDGTNSHTHSKCDTTCIATFTSSSVKNKYKAGKNTKVIEKDFLMYNTSELKKFDMIVYDYKTSNTALLNSLNKLKQHMNKECVLVIGEYESIKNRAGFISGLKAIGGKQKLLNVPNRNGYAFLHIKQ